MKAVKRKDKKVVLDPELKHICIACKQSFQYNYLLKYHIRRYHFNRVGLAPNAGTQNVNDIWVEKVENTDTLVEIKKVNNNEILIQKVNDDSVQPTNIKREDIDVRKDYPVRSGGEDEEECRVCQKSYNRRVLSKHFALKHTLLVRKHCDTCGTTFKHLYNCATHICAGSTIIKKLKKDDNDEWNLID